MQRFGILLCPRRDQGINILGFHEMKFLHVAALLELSAGIVQQMSWEREAAQDLGIDWDVRVFIPENNAYESDIFVRYTDGKGLASDSLMVRVLARMRFRRAYFRWLRSVAKEYDVILLRHNVYSLSQLLFLRSYGWKTITAHHTLEVPELRQGPKFGRREMYVLLERLLGKCSITLARGLLGVTQEIVDYEQSRALAKKDISLVYPNGILYDKPLLSSPEDSKKGEVPEFLFVASSFVAWHGLDLLLNEIKCSSRDFVLHLVGEAITDSDMAVIRSDPRVVLHGRLGQAEIFDLSSQCHIGIASLALNRVDMQEACTLKVREYLYNGLPVYSSHRDVFPESFLYYRQGAVDINQIIEYAAETSSVSASDVISSAEQYISKKMLLSDLNSKLCSHSIRKER